MVLTIKDNYFQKKKKKDNYFLFSCEEQSTFKTNNPWKTDHTSPGSWVSFGPNHHFILKNTNQEYSNNLTSTKNISSCV